MSATFFRPETLLCATDFRQRPQLFLRPGPPVAPLAFYSVLDFRVQGLGFKVTAVVSGSLCDACCFFLRLGS